MAGIYMNTLLTHHFREDYKKILNIT